MQLPGTAILPSTLSAAEDWARHGVRRAYQGQRYAGGTPISVAYETKHTAMIELLERHGGYLDAEFVGSLGLMDRARLMLADEAAGRLSPQALAPGAEGEPVAEHLITFGLR